MKEKSSSSVCAANIYNYLKEIKNKNKPFPLIRKELEQFIASNLKYADDSSVINNILKDFGWSISLSRFTFEDVDLEGLRIALSKKSMKLGGSRASQIAGEKANSKSYVPEMLLSHLSRVLIKDMKKTKIEAESLNFTGVCLLCDISGFTRLSGDYCNLGKNGIDGLQKATNGYMGRLVDTIYAYGGDIIKFAGDAIICVFLDKALKEKNSLNNASSIDENADAGIVQMTSVIGNSPLAGVMNVFSGKSNPTTSVGTVDLMTTTMPHIQVAHPGSSDSLPEDMMMSRSIANHGGTSNSMRVLMNEALQTVLETAPPPSTLDTAPNRAQHPMFDICFNAMQCAMDLREISTDLLTVHVAISCGEMCFGVLGGVQDKWESLISGECLVQLSQCLDDAPSRNVAITKQVAEIVGKDCLNSFGAELMPSSNYLLHQKQAFGENDASMRDNNNNNLNNYVNSVNNSISRDVVELETSASREIVDVSGNNSNNGNNNNSLCQVCNTPEFLDLVDKFVPYPVLVGVRGGELNLLAEIREVTTMFLKFDSYNPDKHKDLLALQQHFYVAQSILFELGAFIRQFLVDDKGCVLIACWGVPTASYLNNALRALRAAALIKGELNRLDMEVSIGITTGNVYCGNVGSEVRREYAAIGDVVNLSARLMSKAKHGILMDEATYKRLDFEVVKSCHPLEPMTVKGKPYPIQAYAFIGEQAPSLKEGSKGDDDEYDIRPMCKIELGKILEELTAPPVRPQMSFAVTIRGDTGLTPTMKVVLLEGKTGTGKSTAVKWFAREAKEREYRVVHVVADSKDTMLEYRLLLKLLKQFLGDEVADNPNHLKMVLMHVLKAIYAGDRNTIDKIAIPAVRVAFGINMLQGAGGGGGALSSSNSAGPGGNAGYSMRMGYSSQPASVALPAGKVPPWMITETIRDIFAFLLNEQPSIIIIENLHYCDESSLKSLLLLQEIKCRSIMMITMLSAEDFAEFQALKHATSLFSGSLTGSSIQTEKASVEWLETFRHIVLQSPNTYHLRLGEFNVTEIDAMIRSGLNTTAKIPLGLCDYVLQISGGSIFWINAIIDFMKTTSPEEFMKMTNDDGFNPQNIAANNNVVGSTTAISNANTSSTNIGSMNAFANKSAKPNRGQLFASFSIAHLAEGQDALSLLKKQENSKMSMVSSGQTTITASGINCSIGTAGSSTVTNQSSMALSGYNGNINKSRLDQFIVVRFERLPLDYQKILKAASVIGYEFNRYVLYGILSNSLKATMYAALKSLVKENWICKPQDANNENGGPGAGAGAGAGDADYVFNHPLIYDIIYDLTPSSDRTALHKSIAEYYESVNFDDPRYFGEMSRHFAYCNTMKAFEYAVKKADYSIVEVGDLELACMILNESLKFVHNAIDAEVVLAVLERARVLFDDSESDENEEHMTSPAESTKGTGLQASKLRRHNSKMRRRAGTIRSQSSRSMDGHFGSSIWSIFFCCSSSSGVIANNAVAPIAVVGSSGKSAASNGVGNKVNSPGVAEASGISFSHRSGLVDGSHKSTVNCYTDKGKGLIARLIHRIDRKVNQLLQMYTDQGKVGRPLAWQIPFLNSDEDDPLMIAEEGQSARSKMSWTYRVPARLRK